MPRVRKRALPGCAIGPEGKSIEYAFAEGEGTREEPAPMKVTLVQVPIDMPVPPVPSTMMLVVTALKKCLLLSPELGTFGICNFINNKKLFFAFFIKLI